MSNPIFSYTHRDYENARKEGLAQIPILSKGAWTDLNATDPGIIILDYVHALVDMIQYYQDHQALETFIVTARERANIFRLAKQLSYEIRSAKGATAEVVFHSDFIYPYPIKIPMYTRLSVYKNEITYITTEDAYLQAGETDVTVSCMQGEVREKVYQGTGISRLSQVEMAENQYIVLTAPNIDIDTISITDGLGRVWDKVEFIVFTKDNEKAYQVDLNPDDTVTILFGDGERGVVPQETDTLTIKYITTNAEEGRVGAGAIINILDEVIYDGKVVEFSVTNPEPSTGGSSSQSSASIRELAPGAIKAQNRAVTLSDFENLAKLVDGVADAKAYDINTKPDLCLFHEVKVVVIPDDNQVNKSMLKDKVYNFLYQKMIPPTNLQVLTPSSIAININVTVKKMSENYDNGALEYQIHEKVKEYFKGRARCIGEDFYPTDLSTVLAGIDGVKYIVSMTPSNVVDIADLSLAELGTLTVDIQ